MARAHKGNNSHVSLGFKTQLQQTTDASLSKLITGEMRMKQAEQLIEEAI